MRKWTWQGSLFRRTIEPGSAAWYFVRDPSALISLGIVALIVFAAILAPFLTPYTLQGQGAPDAPNAFLSPTQQHLFGTDDLGRDELARVLFGARTSLLVGVTVVAFGVVVGTALGAIAGFAGGWVDELIMRFTDVVLSFPPLLLAIVLTAAFQPSLGSTILAISLVWWPWYARLVRAEAVSVRERHFVLAARSIGATRLWILWQHILPNVLGPVRVQGTFDLGAAILTGAALSFLGLGPQPPTPDWGLMIADGRQYLLLGYWWLSVFPGLAIFLIVVAFNLVGDGFQAVVDPRSRRIANA